MTCMVSRRRSAPKRPKSSRHCTRSDGPSSRSETRLKPGLSNIGPCELGREGASRRHFVARELVLRGRTSLSGPSFASSSASLSKCSASPSARPARPRENSSAILSGARCRRGSAPLRRADNRWSEPSSMALGATADVPCPIARSPRATTDSDPWREQSVYRLLHS